MFNTVVLNRTNQRFGRCSTSTVVWHWLTASGLEAADVLAVRQWLEERELLVACLLEQTAEVCPSAGSSALRVCFPKKLESPDMLC